MNAKEAKLAALAVKERNYRIWQATAQFLSNLNVEITPVAAIASEIESFFRQAIQEAIEVGEFRAEFDASDVIHGFENERPELVKAAIADAVNNLRLENYRFLSTSNDEIVGIIFE